MRRAGVIWALVGCGLLVSGCATSNGPGIGSGTQSSGIPPSPKTIKVGSADHTATLQIGDQLVFDSTEPLPSGTRWTVTSYPNGQLTLDSEPGAFPFRFTAVQSGTGNLEVAVQPIVRASGTGSRGLRQLAITVTVDNP
jgi:hypothetical protein